MATLAQIKQRQAEIQEAILKTLGYLVKYTESASKGDAKEAARYLQLAEFSASRRR